MRLSEIKLMPVLILLDFSGSAQKYIMHIIKRMMAVNGSHTHQVHLLDKKQNKSF